MPHAMNFVQSVVVKGQIYVGGGYADLDSGNDHTVMKYDSFTQEWSTLPPYRACDFAMTAVNNQLVLVGGLEDSDESEVLGVWGADHGEWTHPYPDMPTPRSCCSVVVHSEWLVVAGGEAGGRVLSCVEILNIHSEQWYAGPPTPVPWYNMKTALVGNMCYFMGGYIDGWTLNVYCSHIHALINFNVSSEADVEIWKEITALPVDGSSPLSFNDSLLAVGGADKDCKAVTDIRLYQPNTEEWIKVGNLPSPRHHCTCVMVTDRDLLVAGGSDENDDRQVRMDTGQLSDLAMDRGLGVY